MDLKIQRRCQSGLHNFPKSNHKPVLCKGCMYMKLPYEFWKETVQEKEEDKNVITNAFKDMNVGHERKD